MRIFLLSLSAKYQWLVIVLTTLLVAFASSLCIHFLFGSLDLKPKSELITAIYAVLGTIYAVIIAFSISGVWQNYCAAEIAISTEVAGLMDLIHIVKASSTEKVMTLAKLAIHYLKEVIEVEGVSLAKGDNSLIMSPQAKTFTLTMQLVREIQTIQPVDARDNVIFSHALTLLSKWIDARRSRIMLSKGNIAKSHWPLLITGALILFAFHGLFVVENQFLWTTLLLLFSSVIGCSFYLIFTLDNPFSGSPRVDTQPFYWAITWLEYENGLSQV
jgi:hypothetical protein